MRKKFTESEEFIAEDIVIDDLCQKRTRMLNELGRNDPDAWIANFDATDDAVLDPLARAVVTARRKQLTLTRGTHEPSVADAWSGPEIARAIPGMSA